MVSVCTVPARGGRSCEHFGGYKTINRIPLPLQCMAAGSERVMRAWQQNPDSPPHRNLKLCVKP